MIRGPSILRSEIEMAIKDFGRGKENIPAEINDVYKTGIWPNDFLNVTMIAQEKI